MRVPKGAWGLVPIAGVALAAWDYARAGVLPELIWGCNAAALSLGLGLLLGWRRLLWAGTLVLTSALPLWLLWVISHGEEGLHALLTHLAAPALGLLAIRGTQRPAGIVGMTLLGLLLLGALARAVTPPVLDVNFASQSLPVQAALLATAGIVSEGTARLLEGRGPEAALRAALELGDEAGERAFFEHLWKVSRRGPGEKRPLRELVERYRAKDP